MTILTKDLDLSDESVVYIHFNHCLHSVNIWLPCKN